MSSRWRPTTPTTSSSSTGASLWSAPVSRTCCSSWAIYLSRRELGRFGRRPEVWRPPKVSTWSRPATSSGPPSRIPLLPPHKSKTSLRRWSSRISSSWTLVRGRPLWSSKDSHSPERYISPLFTKKTFLSTTQTKQLIAGTSERGITVGLDVLDQHGTCVHHQTVHFNRTTSTVIFSVPALHNLTSNATIQVNEFEIGARPRLDAASQLDSCCSVMCAPCQVEAEMMKRKKETFRRPKTNKDTADATAVDRISSFPPFRFEYGMLSGSLLICICSGCARSRTNLFDGDIDGACRSVPAAQYASLWRLGRRRLPQKRKKWVRHSRRSEPVGGFRF